MHPHPFPALEPPSELDARLHELHSAIDAETFWRANLRLLETAMPHHSCSLMLGIINSQPAAARHHVVADPSPGYLPATSLSVSGEFLARHPRIKLYTFSEVVREDPRAKRRRREQEEALPGNWNEFVHLAFWDRMRPDAVLSIRRSPEHGVFTRGELALLERLHPIIDAGLYRLRAWERERAKSAGMEWFMGRLPMPVLFLDFDLRLLCASQEGFETCARWNFGSRSARQRNPRRVFRLPPEIAAACGRLADEVAASAGRGVVGVEGVRVPHPGDAGLLARVALSQPLRGPWARPGFFVTFATERNADGVVLPSDRHAAAELGALSPSERRVALLAGEGCANLEIARRLGKSVRTVECQLNAIFHKLGVVNRVQLARRLA